MDMRVNESEPDESRSRLEQNGTSPLKIDLAAARLTTGSGSTVAEVRGDSEADAPFSLAEIDNALVDSNDYHDAIIDAQLLPFRIAEMINDWGESSLLIRASAGDTAGEEEGAPDNGVMHLVS